MQRLWIFLSFFIFIGLAHAVPVKDTLELKKHYEHTAERFLRNYDSKVFVTVNLVEKEVNQQLPALPFAIKQSTVVHRRSIELEEVQLKVLTSAANLDQRTVANLMAKIFDKDIPLSVEVVQVDATQFEQKEKVQEDVKPVPMTLPDEVIDYLGQFSGPALYAVPGLFLLLVMIFLFGHRSTGNIIGKAIERAAAIISDAFQSSGGGASVTESAATMGEDSLASADATVSAEQWKVLQELSVQTLSSVFHDAYWGEWDRYAAFLFKGLNPQKKIQLIESSELLKGYFDYLATVLPTQGSYHEDPYYLDPLPLNNLSNADLSATLGGAPALIHELPPLRSARLEVNVVEKISLLKTDKQDRVQIIGEVERIQASTPRSLDYITVDLSLNSIEEEQELMAMESVEMRFIRKMPSLIWLMRLSDEQVAQIFEKQNAAQIAEYWVGPEDVMTRLESLMPEKKLELIKSYTEQRQPTRSSQWLTAVHQEVCILLDEMTDDSPAEEVRDEAA